MKISEKREYFQEASVSSRSGCRVTGLGNVKKVTCTPRLSALDRPATGVAEPADPLTLRARSFCRPWISRPTTQQAPSADRVDAADFSVLHLVSTDKNCSTSCKQVDIKPRNRKHADHNGSFLVARRVQPRFLRGLPPRQPGPGLRRPCLPLPRHEPRALDTRARRWEEESRAV